MFKKLFAVCLFLFIGIAPVAAQDEQTLAFWFEGESPATLALFQGAADSFMAANPGVTIELTAYSFDDMLRTLPLALDGGTGPDIAAVPPLTQGSDRYALAGHLAMLTETAEERGWLDHYSADILAYNNPAIPGEIYGIPYQTNTVGVYYNSQIFEELGLEVPTSIAEFETLMETVKQAGYIPIVVGGLDGWPLSHIFEQLVHTNIEIEHIAKLEQLDPNEHYNSPGIVEAATKLLEWAQNGWIDPNALSTNYADANSQFISGRAALSVTGTWIQADYATQPEFEVRWFPMPRMNTEIPWHMGGFAPYNNLVVPKGDNEALAIEFLNYLLSEENMRYFWDNGILVTYRFDEVPAPTTVLQGDIYPAMQTAGPGYYFGVVNPEVNRAVWAATQSIVGSDLTPQEALDEVEAIYADAAASS